VRRTQTDPALARFTTRIARRDATERRARRARTVCLAVGLVVAFGLWIGGADARSAGLAIAMGLVVADGVGRRIESNRS